MVEKRIVTCPKYTECRYAECSHHGKHDEMISCKDHTNFTNCIFKSGSCIPYVPEPKPEEKLMICSKASECEYTGNCLHIEPHKFEEQSCIEVKCIGDGGGIKDAICIPYTPKTLPVPDHRIHIKGHTCVKDGVQGRMIGSIEGMLNYNDLPDDYRNGYPVCWYPDYHPEKLMLVIYVSMDRMLPWIEPGKFISEAKYQEAMDAIHRCGDRLHRINVGLRAKAKAEAEKIKEQPFEAII